MSEDCYFGDDEETSAETVMRESLKPSAVLSPTQQADFDDIFEGEPDSSLFASSDFDNSEAIPAPTACDEAGADADSSNLSQQLTCRAEPEETSDDYEKHELLEPDHPSNSTTRPNYAPPTVESEESSNNSFDGMSVPEPQQSIFTASGGLGLGDPPYDKLVSSKISDNLLHPTWQKYHHKSDTWSPPVRTPDPLSQRYEHLQELSGETLRTQGCEKHMYSSSASSESGSEEEEEDGQEDAARKPPSPRRNLQTEPPKPANLAQQDKAQYKSQDNDRDGSISASSSAGNTHSSLLHSRPHLSEAEVTPAGVQGHHPSIILRSPRKGMSRASSLASEGGHDSSEPLRPLTEAALRETEISSATETPEVFQNPFSYIHVEPHLRLVAANGLSSPFRCTDAKRSTSSTRSSPPKRPGDCTDAASTLAVTESPMPLLSAVPSRPDTPRPSAELEKLGASYGSHVQPIPTGTYIPSPMTIHPRGTTLDESAQLGHNTHHAASGALLYPRLEGSSCSSSVPTAQIGPRTVLRTILDIHNPVPPPSIPSPKSQTINGHFPRLDIPWQEPRVLPDALECRPPLAQNKDSSRASQHSNASISSEASAPGLRGVIKGESDLSPNTKGSISSTAPPGEDSPLSSPLNGLHDAIQAKRGSRKATTPRHKPVKETTSTRGRAVSLSPKKEKTGTSNSNAPATGVQGEGIKVTKTRPKKPTRVTSRKVTTSKNKSKIGMSDVPEVPDLPESMLIDAPALKPRTIKLNFSAHKYEAPARVLSSAQCAPSKTGTGWEEGNHQGKNLPQTPVEDPATPPSIHRQQLKVHKTRKPVASAKTLPKRNEVDSTTETPKTPEHNHMEIDSISPLREPDMSQEKTQKPNRQTGSTKSCTKRRPAVRKQTPGGIQKASVRKPKTPARLPTHTSSQIADLLEIGEYVELPKKPIRTSPTKAQATPRKATPAPRKMKQDEKASDEGIPPVPMTPKRTNKNGAAEVGGGLTPQSAERGQPRTPSRRSPRLSGIQPGEGL